MVKGRGKGRKQYSAVAREDGDEKMPVRRRGRPLKLLKEDDDMYAYAEEEVEEEEEEEEEEFEKIGKEDGVEERISVGNSVSRTVLKNRAVAVTKKKRKKKRAINIGKKSLDLVMVKEDDEGGMEEDKADVMKTVGAKPIGSSRRKSKPHRAAEVGVECL